MENHAEGELGREEGEEPLGGIHVGLQVQVLEVGPEVWNLFLWVKETYRTRSKRRRACEISSAYKNILY